MGWPPSGARRHGDWKRERQGEAPGRCIFLQRCIFVTVENGKQCKSRNRTTLFLKGNTNKKKNDLLNTSWGTRFLSTSLGVSKPDVSQVVPSFWQTRTNLFGTSSPFLQKRFCCKGLVLCLFLVRYIQWSVFPRHYSKWINTNDKR